PRRPADPPVPPARRRNQVAPRKEPPHMKGISGILLLVVLAAGLATLFSSAYTVAETEQVIVTQFGKPVGKPVVEAGLHFKLPFIQDINVIEKRVLSWDGRPNEMPT